MDDASVALITAFGLIIVALLGLVGVLLRRNNHKGNPGKEMWEKLWTKHEEMDADERETQRIVRDGFAELGRKMDDNRKEIVDAINRQRGSG